MSYFRETVITFDEIKPVISGHPVVMSFLSGEVIYRDDDGAPWVWAIYVERADQCGMVQITDEHGALYEAMKTLFETPEWSDRASEQFTEQKAEDYWSRRTRRAYA